MTPRVPLIGDEGTAEQQAILASEQAALGVVLDATRAYVHVPAFAGALAGLHAALAESATLPPRLSLLARRRVAELIGSPF